MTEAIATLVGSIFSGLVAVYICTVQNDKNMALVIHRLQELEKKQDKFNNVIERMFKVEARVDSLEKVVK